MFYTFEEQKDARYLFSVMAYDIQRANSCCDMILESMKNVPKYIPHYTRVKKLINELHEKRQMTKMTLLERITKLGSIDGVIWMMSRGYVKIEQYEDGSCGYPALDNNGLYSKDSKFKIMEHNFSDILFHHGFFIRKEDYEEWLNNGFSLKQVYLINYENTKKLQEQRNASI